MKIEINIWQNHASSAAACDVENVTLGSDIISIQRCLISIIKLLFFSFVRLVAWNMRRKLYQFHLIKSVRGGSILCIDHLLVAFCTRRSFVGNYVLDFVIIQFHKNKRPSWLQPLSSEKCIEFWEKWSLARFLLSALHYWLRQPWNDLQKPFFFQFPLYKSEKKNTILAVFTSSSKG